MIYAKKSLGQHFLRSERALEKIIEAAKLSPNETVLEIGPGEGVLTERLLNAGARVVAVEKDDNLFVSLQEKFRQEISSDKLKLIHGDILEFADGNIREYKLVANIPYNITGAILEKFLSSSFPPKLTVLLVQKEVAERIVSRDGKESILSVSVKAYGNPRYVDKVLAGSFVPAPQVDSAIIAIEGISKKKLGQVSEKTFFRLLKTGFMSKRKKLSSNLSTICGKKEVQKAFETLNLDPNTRAEELKVEMWVKLAEILNLSLV